MQHAFALQCLHRGRRCSSEQKTSAGQGRRNVRRRRRLWFSITPFTSTDTHSSAPLRSRITSPNPVDRASFANPTFEAHPATASQSGRTPTHSDSDPLRPPQLRRSYILGKTGRNRRSMDDRAAPPASTSRLEEGPRGDGTDDGLAKKKKKLPACDACQSNRACGRMGSSETDSCAPGSRQVTPRTVPSCPSAALVPALHRQEDQVSNSREVCEGGGELTRRRWQVLDDAGRSQEASPANREADRGGQVSS